MKTIWKFKLGTADNRQTFAIPQDGKILWVAVQRETPCIWVEVDPEAPKCNRQFAVYGTGHPMPAANRQFVSSFMLMIDSCVFHLYESTAERLAEECTEMQTVKTEIRKIALGYDLKYKINNMRMETYLAPEYVQLKKGHPELRFEEFIKEVIE